MQIRRILKKYFKKCDVSYVLHKISLLCWFFIKSSPVAWFSSGSLIFGLTFLFYSLVAITCVTVLAVYNDFR